MDGFGFRVRSIDPSIEMDDWSEQQCERIGHALTTLVRTRIYGAAALEGWRNEFPQLNVLFDEIPGFHEFMLHIANKKARDSIYGTVYQVALGAILSTSDIISDIYIVATYYKTPELVGRANALLAMFTVNAVCQIALGNFVHYGKKSTATKMKEALISKVKAIAKTSGGKQIEGLNIIQTSTARRRNA